MRFVTTRGIAPAVTLGTALFEGLAPDGGLYVPGHLERLTSAELEGLCELSLVQIAERVLLPFVRDELDASALTEVVRDALTFPIPLVHVHGSVWALELFHGPTLAFKDVGARVLARLLAALYDGGEPLVVLVATSGDTGSAVAHAFAGVPNVRVVVLYPDRRVSPTQEAQLTRFNADAASNVRAFAVGGSFDDCQKLTKSAFASADLRRRVRLTSANSINVGRLLPQIVYYFHAAASAWRAGGSKAVSEILFSTPSGNFGNLTAGLLAKSCGLPVSTFIAATNVNDVVPSYLRTGQFTPRPSVPTLANAMDVGNPSNFDRMLWLYRGDIDALRRDVVGSPHDDDEIRATIRRVDREYDYLLDPHSAIAYLGITRCRQAYADARIFLATAHPAKFAEIVEPIVGRSIDKPAALAEVLSRPPRVFRVEATLGALSEILGG